MRCFRNRQPNFPGDFRVCIENLVDLDSESTIKFSVRRNLVQLLITDFKFLELTVG